MTKRRKPIILALGSNTDSNLSMPRAMHLLQEQLDDLTFTPIIMTEAIGISSNLFANCLASGYTVKKADEVIQILKSTEQQCGDLPTLRAERKVVMDIDLLLLGQKKYHIDDWNRSYIQQLMKLKDHPL